MDVFKFKCIEELIERTSAAIDAYSNDVEGDWDFMMKDVVKKNSLKVDLSKGYIRFYKDSWKDFNGERVYIKASLNLKRKLFFKKYSLQFSVEPALVAIPKNLRDLVVSELEAFVEDFDIELFVKNGNDLITQKAQDIFKDF